MIKKYLFIFWIALFQITGLFAQLNPDAPQVPGAPNVTITNQDIIYNADLDRYELHLPCGVDQIDLNGTFTPGRETDEYVVSSIPYNPPFPFIGGSGSTSITADDQWSQAITLPWNFCYFGYHYDKALVSSNGALTFDVVGETVNANGNTGRYSPGTGSSWSFSNSLPYNAAGTSAPFINTIFGVFQDTNPATSFAGWNINYEVIGEAPYRTLVFNLYKLGQYSCTTNIGEQTYQMVLYEATNIIDVYVENRTACDGSGGRNNWQNGVGLIGIQSHPNIQGGLKAYTPPGRNTGAWEASEEAWRFTPSGNIITNVTWTADGVTVYSDDTPDGNHNQNFTFTELETTVKLEVSYQICSSIRGTVSDEFELVVFLDPAFSVDLGPDIVTCEASVDLFPIIHDEDGTLIPITDFDQFDFLWSPGGETTPGITVTESGDYTLEVTRGDCTVTTTINVDIGANLVLNNPIAPYSMCPDENGEAVFDLTSWYTQIIADPTDLTFVFYESEANAIADANEILDPENHLVTTPPGSQQIWVVVTNADGCTGMGSFMLEVEELNFNEVTPYIVCDNEGIGTGAFDLDSQIPAITAGIPANLGVTFHPTQADADVNTGDIASPYNAADGTIVYVRVVDLDNGCSATYEMTLELGQGPDVQDLPLYELCGFDGVAEFDLPSRTTTMLAGLTNGTATFFEDEDDAYDIDSTNEITDPAAFENTTVDAQIIYVRVQEGNSPCFTVIELPLEVLPRPVVNTNIPDYAICEIANGEAEFDLTSIEVITNPADFDISYYLSSDDARTSTDPIDAVEVDAYTSASTTIWVRVEDPVNGCYDITSFDLVVNLLPVLLTDEVELSECVGDTFDLTEAEDLLMVDGTGFVFTYYNDLTDAETPQNAIDASVPYTGVDGEEIFVRIDSAEGCTVYATLTLRLVAAQVVDPLVDYELCDEGNNRADFDLASLVPGIQNGDTNLEVTFYLTEALAYEGEVANQIDLTQDYNSTTRTIWVRVVESGLACPAVVSLNLVVNPLPVLPTSVVMVACEDAIQDNVFDLTDTQLHADIFAVIVGDALEYEVYFFGTQNQAINAPITAAIDTSIPYQTAATTRIWVRVVHTATGCEAITPLDLTVNPLPVINPIGPLRVCDEGMANGLAEFDLNQATIGMVGTSNYGVTYYIDEPAAELGDVTVALPIDYTNTTPYNQTIFARIADNITGCHIVVPVELVVEAAPEANIPEPLIYCDPNNDGEGIFHLPDAISDITSDPDAVVTFHRTWADADNDGANPLDDTINNNELDGQTSQIIYVRVSIEGLDCYSIVELELIVLPTPVLETPAEIIIGCDIDDNGTPIFNLEEIVLEQVVIHLTNLDDYNIYYYANADNRDNDVRIPVPTAYPSAGGIVIVVVEDIATGCTSEVEIELFVAPLPEVVHPVHMEVCDVNNPGDEIELFYLDEAVEEITNGDTSLTVSFHLTQEDANEGENPLAIPYQNTHNNQTIYIRVENEYGCTVTEGITLTLVVNPLPAPVTPAPLEVCDIDNEGFAYFDLESLKDGIIASEPGVDVSFHETYSDAQTGWEPLSSPYQNIVGGEQVIFARVFFADQPDGTGCFTIIEIILRAVPSPVVPVELDDLYFCAADADTSIRVNLTVYEDLIYGDQDRDELRLTYHLSQAAAVGNTGAIADPTDFLLNPPTPLTIYVRLGYTGGVCYNIVPFTLHLIEGPEINDPTALSVCAPIGEPNTATAVFDLLDKREEILGVGTTGLGIYFYENEADALIGNDNYIANPTNYTNITNPQTIYVRVKDSQENSLDDTGCVAFTTLTLRVDPNPEPGIPDPIVYCLLDNDLDYRRVDLTIRELQILNHESWDLEYYRRYRDAVSGDPFERIVSPEDYEIALADSPLTFYVRVINPITGCFEIVELEVILSTLPEVLPPEDIEPMIVCSTDNKDWALFDLTEKLPDIFGNQDLDGLNVFFYEDLEDAIDGVNPIIDPENFYNTSNPQTIYVGVGNPEIDDCYIGGLTWFEIEILEGAFANSPEETYKVCGVPSAGGGVATFDLRNQDLIESILGLQDPSFFDVDYYLTEDDAHEAAAGTALGNTYENISNPQTIYVRVTNQETGCYAIAEVILEVIVIENLILEDLYSLCTDAQGNPMVDADGNIIYPIIDTGLDVDGFTFRWFFEGERIIGQVGPVLVAEQIGNYRVEIVSLDTGCTLSLDIEVVSSSMPFNYGAEVTSPAFSGTYNVEAWVEGLGDYWFSIDGGAEQNHGSFTNVGTGTHVITITDRNGCGSVDIIVNVVDYPKFFTPNDDGYNDTWNIPGMADLDPSAEIFIFDRHGKLLKQINPRSEGWNGTFNGNPLPSTDYWFVVKYMEDGVPREFKGHFSLKR